MGRPSKGYLHRNRHGTFNFRWRPPQDLRGRFGQAIYVFSLRTKSRDCAWRRALAPARRFALLVECLRVTKRHKHKLLSFELIRRFTMPDGSEQEVDYDPSNPAEVAEATRIFAELSDAKHVANDQLSTLDPSPRSNRTPANTGLTISDAFKRFCTERRSTGAWKDGEHMQRYDYGPVVDALINVAGDRAIASVSVQHLRSVKDKLLSEPSTITTKQKKLGRLKSFLDWARDIEQLTPVSTAMLRTSAAKAQAKHYEPFTNAELKALFESEMYRSQNFGKASEFWIPLIGLYTGARINELAQLTVNDISEQDGVPFISINDEDGKRTKTAASVRKVPIHPVLIEAGLLDYQALIAAEGWTRLFPELTMAKAKKNQYGKEPSSFFTAYRRACGVAREQDRHKVFHSFRTTANSALRFADVPQERRERLVGHESDAVNNVSYRPSDRDKMFPLATLLDDLQNLRFGLKHPKYEAVATHRVARLKAARSRVSSDRAEEGDRQALGG